MLQRLKRMLKLNHIEESPKLEIVVEELSSGIHAIKEQLQKISKQESEIVEKLENYTKQHKDKIAYAKEAFLCKNKIVAEGFYSESKILQQQVLQYQRIAEEIQKTKQKLLSQENQFCYTKDQLIAKQTLGNANVDSSQARAEIGEHLMLLNESKELQRFDELIEDADNKSQAIKEIQGDEQAFESLLNGPSSSTQSLEEVIAKEKEEKLLIAQKNLRISINRVFGELGAFENVSQKENQKALLNRLKEQEAVNEIEKFFTNPSSEPQTQSNVKENEDRIINFFESAKPAGGKTTDGSKDLINQFFNSKQ